MNADYIKIHQDGRITVQKCQLGWQLLSCPLKAGNTEHPEHCNINCARATVSDGKEHSTVTTCSTSHTTGDMNYEQDEL